MHQNEDFFWGGGSEIQSYCIVTLVLEAPSQESCYRLVNAYFL